MVSRKKAQGKERKNKAAIQGMLGLSQAEARRRLKWTSVANPALGHAFICSHGCPPLPPPGHPVAKLFDMLMHFEEENLNRPMYYVMSREFDRHRAVFDNATLRKMVISIMLTMGVNLILNDDNMGLVAMYASYILHIEIYGCVGNIEAALWRSGRLEIDIKQGGWERDVIQFFIKRITCSCLTATYSQAKVSQPKIMGKCDYCEKKRERRTLMLCERCKTVQYCCTACQADDWQYHKYCCKDFWDRLCSSSLDNESSCAHKNNLQKSPW
jgi:hypothetical protein